MFHRRRTRSSVVILRGGKILLMSRRKNGEEYYILPGGGKNWYETPRMAARREALEETGLKIKIDRELFREKTESVKHYCFLAKPSEGAPVLGGNEARINSAENSYGLEWISIEDLPRTRLLSDSTKELLLKILNSA